MPTSMKGVYDKLPASLKSEVMVRVRQEDPEVQRERAELVKSKSPTELSQMTSLSDFPLPSTIEQYVRPARSSKEPGAVERKKRFRDKQRSLSAKNLYDSLPRGLKTDLLVKSRMEDPEVQKARAQLVSSKSVSELSQVTSLSDFPVPATIERMVTKVRDRGASDSTERKMPGLNTQEIYATLPKSLKSELHVRSRVEDPDVQRQRKELIQSKSVSELAQVKSLADFPIPANIEKLIQSRGASASAKQSTAAGSEKAESLYPKMAESLYPRMEDIYASLPRSLKSQVMVRTKVEEDEEELKRRQNLVQSKSPGELSQIHNFKEIPLPRRIEAWMHQSEQQKPKPATRSLHELRGNIYDTLPKSLKEPTLVRAKVEDPEKQRERCELTRAKTPSQLAQINDIHDIPIPFLWHDKTTTSAKKESSTLPKNPQEVKELVYNTVFPESMTKPCVVRSRIEDPMTLRERQDLQQRKSIHELSKIRNLNEFPLPFKVPLPDVPLPSAKGILQVIARNPRAKKSNTTSQDFVSYTPASTPAEEPFTDDEMLRFDASTPGGDLQHRDQDFGYEVIDHGAVGGGADGAPAADVEEDTLADQYRGTPPLRSKKPQRPRSHNIPEQVQLSDDTPPPLPPKRQSPAVASRVDLTVTEAANAAPPPKAVPRQRKKGPEPVYETLEPQCKIAYAYSNDPARSVTSSSIVVRPLPETPSDEQDQQHPPPLSHSGSSQRVPDASFHSCADDDAPDSIRSIQGRPLPRAPAAGVRMSGTSDQFHSVASTLDRTLVDSKAAAAGSEEDEATLAESIVDSMHSCADTFRTAATDEEQTLHSCADTLEGDPDNDSLRDFESPTPPASVGSNK